MNVLSLEAVDEARELVADLVREMAWLEAVVLDSDWRGGARLVYSGDCGRVCEKCFLLKTVGEDPGLSLNENRLFIPSLVLASEIDLKKYPGKQKYLNCKSLEEYAGCFAACLSNPLFCPDTESIREELELVNNFRIIFVLELKDKQVSRIEKELKERIISLVGISRDDSRRAFFDFYVEKLGLR